MAQRILLADDEMALRFLISETLSDVGYEIHEAEDGGEALHLLKREAYDLVILDFMMPEKTGVEVCEWLRAERGSPNQAVPVILLTAKALEKDREMARAAGVTAYIVKPFSPIHLLQAVEELLASTGREG